MTTESAIIYTTVLDSITGFYQTQRQRRQHALSKLVPAFVQLVDTSRERNRTGKP